MPLSVDRFVTPEQDFRGLYVAADTLERRRYRDEQMRLREEERQQQREAKRAASARFFANYLDPKERFTGTNYDPETYRLLNDALGQAYDLSAQGANDTDILAAINPLINKANQYTQSAKLYSQRKKDYLDNLKLQKGYNIDAVSRAIDDAAFINDDGTMKDVNMVDPDLLPQYIEKALLTKEGLSKPLGNIGEQLRKNDLIQTKARVKMTNARGGISLRDSDVKMYDWMQTDNEGNFVPKFEHAKDGEDYVKFHFANQDREGKVRLLDRGVFDNLINEDPAYKLSLMQQIKKAGYSGDFKGDEASYNAARALAYQDADQYKKGYIYSGSETKAPQINISMSGATEANLNNIYERIKQKGFQRVKDYSEGKYFDNSLQKEDLSGDELDATLKATGDKTITPDDIKIIVENDGRIGVYDKGSGHRLVYMNQTGTNLPRQANVAGKRTSVYLGNEPYKPVSVPKLKSTEDNDPLKIRE